MGDEFLKIVKKVGGDQNKPLLKTTRIAFSP
jgi:hypothetical protein